MQNKSRLGAIFMKRVKQFAWALPITCRATAALFLVLLLVVSAACSRKSSAPARTYLMGERVQVGPLAYSVLDTQWKNELAEGAETKLPSSRFLVVRLSATNGGVDSTSLPTFEVVNSSGTAYQEVHEVIGVPQWLGLFRNLRPAETEQGNVVFDVPVGAYKLRIQGETAAGEEVTALVDLPLNLDPTKPIPVEPVAPAGM
jgi:hypothetical protein